MLDDNHFPGTEKRIAPLRGHRGAALPGQPVVVYDRDSSLVLDMVAGEDAHQTERVPASTLLSRAEAGQVWVADRHFCTRALLEGWEAAGSKPARSASRPSRWKGTRRPGAGWN